LRDPKLTGKVGHFDWHLPDLGQIGLLNGNADPYDIDEAKRLGMTKDPGNVMDMIRAGRITYRLWPVQQDFETWNDYCSTNLFTGKVRSGAGGLELDGPSGRLRLAGGADAGDTATDDHGSRHQDPPQRRGSGRQRERGPGQGDRRRIRGRHGDGEPGNGPGPGNPAAEGP
jgi:hypothetical protein